MIDNYALALSHGLILLMAWRLLSRSDLDDDDGKKRPTFAAAPDAAAGQDFSGGQAGANPPGA